MAGRVLAAQRLAGNRATALAMPRLTGQATTLAVQRRAPQATTLDEAGAKAGKLPEAGLEHMKPGEIQENWGPADRTAWYAKALGRFEAQLEESAARHAIPEQVLAVVVLNEMADIKWKDVWEMKLEMTNVSLGIGQIEVTTAIKDKLLPTKVPAEAARLLRIPQWNIEAVAAEIAHLLALMAGNLDKPWQQHFGYTGGPTTKLLEQVSLGGSSPLAAAAAMVVGAYNSPGMVTTTQATLDRLVPGEKQVHKQFIAVFPNGGPHAANSIKIANDIAAAGMFLPSGRPAPHPASDLAGYDK